MRNAVPVAFAVFLVVILVSAAAGLADSSDISINMQLDKRIVPAGGNLSLSGSITYENGTSGNFDYRIAVVAPGRKDGGDRIIVCDSAKKSTNGTANVSFLCQVPTIEGLQQMGIENAAERSVIPLKGGIAVLDTSTNKTAKKHGEALIVNSDKIRAKLESASDRLDAFINKSEELGSRCDNITARAAEAGAQNVVERCADFQMKLQNKIDSAVQAKDRINDALGSLGNLTSFNFRDLKDRLLNFGDGVKDFKIETGGLKDFVEKAKTDLEKKVSKEISNRTKERAAELREKIVKEKVKIEEKIKEIKKKVDERKSGRQGNAATTASNKTGDR